MVLALCLAATAAGADPAIQLEWDPAAAGSARLEWDPVNDSRVDHYVVHYGVTSGEYDEQIETAATCLEIPHLFQGVTYYFAARACNALETECSDLSNELSATIPYPEPVADFTVSVMSGSAPLVVTFADTSTDATSRAWAFGDGGSSTAQTAVYTYEQSGTFTVTLTITGPGGTTDSRSALIEVESPQIVADQSTRPEGDESAPSGMPASDMDLDADQHLPIEIGDILVSHRRQRVTFERTFTDPIVVVKGMSYRGGQPGVLRIDGVDEDGFWIRVQEWEYLDQWHKSEQVSYLAMERGRYQLPNGFFVEAGSVETGATSAFEYAPFIEELTEVPVVLAAVTTDNDAHAVNARLREIATHGFYVGMCEQEANKQRHGLERIDYIAWEPSLGVIGDIRYEVGRTGDRVTDKRHKIRYETLFARPPVLVADMQTTDGGDTASLRWAGLGEAEVEIWVQEEQSRDEKTRHTTEDVGYFVADVE